MANSEINPFAEEAPMPTYEEIWAQLEFIQLQKEHLLHLLAIVSLEGFNENS